MATHDYIISNASGASVRADLNNALAAIVSNNSNATSPATTYAYQWWADTTTGQLKLRNSANSAWITIFELDGTMLMEDGTVSAPGLAFASDLNTGFFRSAADKINFATGGAERLEIGSSEVVFNDPSNDVDFRVESNGNANMLFVDAGNDRVGIGESSPSAKLQISSPSSTEEGFRVVQTTAGRTSGSALALIYDDQTGTTSPTLKVIQNGTGDIFQLFDGGTAQFVVKDGGDVGIGTSSPHSNSGTNLHIHGSNTTAELRLTNTTTGTGANGSVIQQGGNTLYISNSEAGNIAFENNGSERAKIDSSGRLLVGTSSARSNLFASSSFRAPIQMEGTNNATRFISNIQNSNGTSGPGLILGKSRGTSVGANTTVQSGDTVGDVYFMGADGSNLIQAAKIQAEIDGTPGSNDMPGRLMLATTASGASSPTERVRVDSSGNVGIGSSDPADKLEVVGDIRLKPASGANTLINFEYNNGVFAQIRGNGRSGSPLYGDLEFWTRGSADSAPLERMVVAEGGNVGIGATAPSVALEVVRTSDMAVFASTTGTNNSARFEARSGSGTTSGKYAYIRFNNNDTNNQRYDVGTYGTDDLTFRDTKAGSTRMTLDTSGRLLVGTSSSRSTFGIQPAVQVEGTGYDTGSLSLAVNQSSSSSIAPYLSFVRTRGSSVGSNTLVQDDDLLGAISWTGADGTDTANASATISARIDGTPGSNDMPGKIVFSVTADGAISPTERMRISQDGKISTVNGGYFNGTNNGDTPFTNAPIVLQNTSNNTNATMIQFKGYNGSQTGSISTRVNVTTYSTSSDYRLKENVIDIADGITRVKQLAPKRFNFIGHDDTTCDGFLAHEAQAVVPEAVVGTHNEVDGDGNAVMQGIDQSKLVPLLTAALQEAIAKIETLETKVAALEAG